MNTRDVVQPEPARANGWGVRNAWSPRLLDRALLAVPLIFVFVFFIYPLGSMVLRSLGNPWTPQEYSALFSDSVFLRSLLRTLVLSALASLACLVLAYPIAYEVTRDTSPWRRLLVGMVVLTLWISVLVRTYSWLLLLQGTGPANYLLMRSGLVDQPVTLVRNLPGIFIGMTHILLPYMVLALVPSMRAVDDRLLQAAQSLGASKRKVMVKVFFPLTVGGVAAGLLLTFVIGLGFYLTPAILGGPSDLFVSQLIAREIVQLTNYSTAAAMSVILTSVVVIVYVCLLRVLDPTRIWGSAPQ